MSGERTVKFIVKPTGSSNFSLRFWHVITLPFRRTIPAVAFATVVWAISYNVGVRPYPRVGVGMSSEMTWPQYWKGPDHPVNRFQWRRMEKAGTLPDELLQKKKVVLEYHKSRFYNPRSAAIITDDFD